MKTPFAKHILRHPHYRRIWMAQVFSELGDWAGRLAIALYILHRTGSATAAGLALATTVAASLLAPLLGSLGDRFPPIRVMIICDVVRAALFSAVLVAPFGLIYPLLFLVGLAAIPFTTARLKLYPYLLPDETQMQQARHFSYSTNQSVQILGFVAGGILVQAMGASWVLLIDAASFILSAILLAGITVAIPADSSIRRLISAGYRAVWHHSDMRQACLLMAVGLAGFSVSVELVALFVQEQYGPHSWLLGLLPALFPLGILLGKRILGIWPPTKDVATLLLRGRLITIAGSAAALAGLALGSRPWASVAAFLAMGIATGSSYLYRDIMQYVVPKAIFASAGGFLQSFLQTVAVLSLLLASLLIGSMGPTKACIVLIGISCSYTLFSLLHNLTLKTRKYLTKGTL